MIETARRYHSVVTFFKPRVVLLAHEGCGATFDELKKIAPALQAQVDRDFGPMYGLTCTVVAADVGAVVEPTDWVIGMFKDADQPGALGYHDTTVWGLPLAKVFPILDAKDGAKLSVTISHELLEMLADPLLTKAVQSAIDGKFWAYEVCDAVENDEYAIDGVSVSNFVTPQYFEPPHTLAGIQLDFMKLVKKPFEVRPGGYMQWNDGSGWNQVTAATKLRTYRSDDSPKARHSRSAARARRFDAAVRLARENVDEKFDAEV